MRLSQERTAAMDITDLTPINFAELSAAKGSGMEL